MTLSIDYRLVDVGWAECDVRWGGSSCAITASYLSDALGKLVFAALAVLNGVHSISIGFDEEPGEYRWSLANTETKQLSLRLLAFDELWASKPDAQGRVLFEGFVSHLEFAEAVAETAARVLKRHGLDGYKDAWVGHEFPSRDFEQLIARIERWRNPVYPE